MASAGLQSSTKAGAGMDTATIGAMEKVRTSCFRPRKQLFPGIPADGLVSFHLATVQWVSLNSGGRIPPTGDTECLDMS